MIKVQYQPVIAGGARFGVFEIADMETLECLIKIAHVLPFDGSASPEIHEGSQIEP